jgi:hypothetical protein
VGHASSVEWITGEVLRAIESGERTTPHALLFLLRRYSTTGNEILSEALGPALARALEMSVAREQDDARAQWLTLFVEAAGLSADDRLLPAVNDLTEGLIHGWPNAGSVAAASRAVEACLAATRVNGAWLATAIDELERIIGVSYQPGDGLTHNLVITARESGRLEDYAAASSALLSAYTATGRLPYSMLAEELMQFARRSWWDSTNGGFSGCVSPPFTGRERELFTANCHAVRVLCRLAELHRDEEYRQMAVIAHASDYANDAARTLRSLEGHYQSFGVDAALYGIALGEAEALRLAVNLQ